MTVGLAGATEIDVRTAGLTVKDVELVTPSKVALIDEVPIASADAKPVDPGAFEIVAVAVFADAQVTSVVRFSVELSANVPVAVSPSLSPLGTVGAAGVMASD